jgi:hypothetical protein
MKTSQIRIVLHLDPEDAVNFMSYVYAYNSTPEKIIIPLIEDNIELMKEHSDVDAWKEQNRRFKEGITHYRDEYMPSQQELFTEKALDISRKKTKRRRFPKNE